MRRKGPQRRLGVASLGFLRQRWLVRALDEMGWTVVPGVARCDAIGIWGNRPVAARGRALAARRGLPLVHIEDAFLRSLRPGDAPPLGLMLDEKAAHFDASRASALEDLLNARPVPTGETRDALALLRHYRLSKYNDWPAVPTRLPEAFVLVVDQVPGDAALNGAGRAEFRAMLDAARRDHPDLPILIRSHPATRERHLGTDVLGRDAALLPDGLNPWDVLRHASAVHVHSSHLGAEAILAGHRPVIHGSPWYAGWGLSVDRHAFPRRTARLSAEQLFEGGWNRAAQWFDPAHQRPRSLLATVEDIAARVEGARRLGKTPIRVQGCSRWKRRRVAALLSGGGAKVRFGTGSGRPVLWASRAAPTRKGARIEDGFIRSRGLGAALVEPLSLVHDAAGIHYDPARQSDLEGMIAASLDLPEAALQRAARLRARIVAEGVSKYGLERAEISRPSGRHVILIPGQVADDASVCMGGVAGGDQAVIDAARATHPDSHMVFRPHPDVLAGLREGMRNPSGVDEVAGQGDVSQWLEKVDAVWTNTSLTGFEALLREVPVTCLGQPFYAGWGLTQDVSGAPSRRKARPTPDQFVHAVLIDYPLYFDPEAGRLCAVERVLDLLAAKDGVARPVRGRIAALLRNR